MTAIISGSKGSKDQGIKGSREASRSVSEYFDYAQHKDPAMLRSYKAGGAKEKGVILDGKPIPNNLKGKNSERSSLKRQMLIRCKL